MGYLLDTSVAIHLRDRDRSIIERLVATDEPAQLSILSLVELEAGVQRDQALAAGRREILDVMLARFDVVGFDEWIVRTYGRIVAQCGFSRRKVLDRLIAATAIVNDMTLVTINGDDFADVPDLRLEVWPAQ